jgi:hypothetical protein
MVRGDVQAYLKKKQDRDAGPAVDHRNDILRLVIGQFVVTFHTSFCLKGIAGINGLNTCSISCEICSCIAFIITL